MSRVLLVGGTFDKEQGHESGVIYKLFNYLNEVRGHTGLISEITMVNGGTYKDLEATYYTQIKEHDIIIWWADVPNEYKKLRDIKSMNKKAIYISSKNNREGKYEFRELINRALEVKANLCVEIYARCVIDTEFHFRLFDPLGNVWYDGSSIAKLADAMFLRAHDLLTRVTRQGSLRIGNITNPTPDESEFFEIIKQHAEVFHNIIDPEPGVTRFLGNASFRCTRGFPSFRGDDGLIYVSKRNVDKRYIDKDAFVPCQFVDNTVCYQGDNKPSVDTPIQLRLYRNLKNINYMIHSHVYISTAGFTNKYYPCGALEESDEILKYIDEVYGSRDEEYYVINLKGHGSIVMSSSTKRLEEIPYVARHIPEEMNGIRSRWLF